MHQVISFSVINYVVSMRGPHGSGDNLFFFVYIPSLFQIHFFHLITIRLQGSFQGFLSDMDWICRKIRDKEQIISLYLISVVEFIYSWRSAKPNKFAFALA